MGKSGMSHFAVRTLGVIPYEGEILLSENPKP